MVTTAWGRAGNWSVGSEHSHCASLVCCVFYYHESFSLPLPEGDMVSMSRLGQGGSMEASGHQRYGQEYFSLLSRVICLISLDFLLNQVAPLVRQRCLGKGFGKKEVQSLENFPWREP